MQHCNGSQLFYFSLSSGNRYAISSSKSLYQRAGKTVVLILWVTVLAGCVAKTPEATIPIDEPEAFSETGEVEAPDEWWLSFNDPILDTLVESALASNFDLIATWYRFQETRAIVDRQPSFLIPDIEASILSSLNRPQPDFAGGENVQLGVSAFYEIDLWGRISVLVDAEKYRAEATFADYQTAAISLAAEVSLVWYLLLTAREQLQVINNQLATNEEIISFIKAQFGSGQIRSVDMLRQQQLLEAKREQRIQAEAQIEVLEHQMAVLLG